MAKTISPEVVQKVGDVLQDVMGELRALRDVSTTADDSFTEPDTFPLLAGAVCERAHVMLDRCAVALGAIPTGAFDLDARLSVSDAGRERKGANA